MEADVVSEGRRVLDRAAAEDVPLRLLGGVAVHLRAPAEPEPAFERSYADLDAIVARGRSGAAQAFFRQEGYEPQIAFNALNGNERLLFFDNEHDRQVDVFVGDFRMSHRIPIGDRLAVDPVSVPLAELLLTKLQIAQLNEKDVRDTLWLVHDHDLAEEDGDSINVGRVAELCAADWGLWRTITENLGACRAFASKWEVPRHEEIERRLGGLLERIEAEPKTRGWKLRARIGERKRWYDLPEEVAGGP